MLRCKMWYQVQSIFVALITLWAAVVYPAITCGGWVQVTQPNSHPALHTFHLTHMHTHILLGPWDTGHHSHILGPWDMGHHCSLCA